ncbi:MAG TPA: type II toxin-antitoxin system RelE/ParE family toxin [Candidatus Angelobacter sp.]|jgi:toxin ParE1/3/4|nr:type II toxin-antitoxin system RelE/ParE family toxin [Candidatus Angelobacter sp.]
MAHRLAPEAETDLDDIWYYIAKESNSIQIADRFSESIANRFFLLATNPHIGRSRDEDLRPGLRSFPVGQYVIIYRIEDNNVLVLRVIRGSRNIEALFRL